MKVQIACLAALGAVAVGPQFAAAADFGNIPAGGVVNGGIRDYGGAGGVPVPSPVPIPDYKPSFYFRIDGGYGVMSQPSVSESGYKYGGEIGTPNGANANGTEGALAATLLQTDPSWLGEDFENLMTYGAGVGYYLGDGWRVDATIEGRSKDEVSINGANSWTSFGTRDVDSDPTTPNVLTSDLNLDGTFNDRTTRIVIKDKTEIKGTVWMANMYYDLMSTGGFTPYVGAGLGFVWNEMKRTHTTTVTSESNVSPIDLQTPFSSSTSENSDSVSLAAALMVGASYQITEITSLDFGYRFLYLGGTSADMNVDGYNSHLEIGDQYVHQLRAGLRFDVN